ncbi:probable ATP-dependent RNA helicase DDX56 [Terrapene carolina triunguis]|nr:probable ATP-dependent RNA helicase DDX56 [Terrapene carolina triunguis]
MELEPSFAHMGLDGRLLQAIAELGWAKPTLIQEKAIPLALEGKDLLARARTGSGKTAAYAIPLLQHLLQVKMSPLVMEQAVRGLVLVPTKELGQQVLQMIRQLTAYCSRDVRVADVSGQVDMSAQRPILMEKPDVVVGTPSRVLAHLQGHSLSLRHSLEVLVLDEADLLFSFGFEEDLKNLLWGKDPEYGVARGIDFQNVATIINFDPPPSVESYIHRAGRTARADNPGTALTFVTHPECPLLAEIEEALAGESTEPVLRPYQFRMEEVEGLRYRCRDAMRSITKQAIKEARLREIKEELLNSEKLKTYFEDNPHDLRLLRHDRPLHPAIVKPHLRNVPEYLVPPTLRAIAQPLLNKRKRRKHLAPSSRRPRGGFQARGGRNPLRSFQYMGRRPRRPASKGKTS